MRNCFGFNCFRIRLAPIGVAARRCGRIKAGAMAEPRISGKEGLLPATYLLPRFTRQGAVTASPPRALGAIGFATGNHVPCGLRVASSARLDFGRGFGRISCERGIYFFLKIEVDKPLMLVSELSFYEISLFLK